jgi:hypothetical protein
MAEYWSIEVFHDQIPATAWRQSWGSELTEAALSHGAQEWAWIETRWGVVLELGFADEEQWLRFRALPVVRAALDAVPDPVSGLLVYRGRGGSAGATRPRRPRPTAGAGAVALDEVVTEQVVDLTRSAYCDRGALTAAGDPAVLAV